MKNPARKQNTLPFALAALCVAAAATGWGAARRNAAVEARRGSTPAAATNAANDVLAAIPAPNAIAATPADNEIAKWRDRARTRPADAAAWTNLGDALMQKARESADPHYYDYAEQTYQKALALSPKKVGALTGMAWVCGGRHQFDESIAWANKALAVSAREPSAYGLIGDAQIEQGDYNAAFKSYQTMLDIRPDLASYSRGAHLLFLSGDTRKAVWLMNKAVKAGGPFAENTAWCRAQLAEMLWSTGAVVPAEQILTEALKSAPTNYHVLTAMGKVKEAKGDTAGAIACYQKAIAATPQHAALVALGDAYLAAGKKAQAEAQFALVEKTHEHNQQHGFHDELYLARFFADHDRQLPRALAIAKAHRDVKSPVDLDSVAWVFYKNNKLADAKAFADKALAIGSPDAARLYHGGMIHARLGQRGPAQSLLSRALSLNPHFSPIHAPLAAAKMKELGQVAAGGQPKP